MVFSLSLKRRVACCELSSKTCANVLLRTQAMPSWKRSIARKTLQTGDKSKAWGFRERARSTGKSLGEGGVQPAEKGLRYVACEGVLRNEATCSVETEGVVGVYADGASAAIDRFVAHRFRDVHVEGVMALVGDAQAQRNGSQFVRQQRVALVVQAGVRIVGRDVRRDA